MINSVHCIRFIFVCHDCFCPIYRKHRNLVSRFFHNARGMLRADGEIHINHKTTPPFCLWNLPELAINNSLTLIECVDFRIEDYPGYSNKRGDGSKCDDSFPLGDCSTFKFILTPPAKKSKVGNSDIIQGKTQALQLIPIHLQKQPISFNWRPQMNSIVCNGDMLEYTRLPLDNNMTDECFRIFGEYLYHASETFGRTDYDVSYTVREALRLGYRRYMAEDSGRSLNGYIGILQELNHLSILRLRWLQTRLAAVCHLQR